MADDDVLIRRTMVAVVEYEPGLELAGVAEHTEEALAMARDADVLLADVRMPGGGALAAATGLREAGEHCVVVALTGFDSVRDRRRLMEAGVAACLVKGCPIEEIVEAVRTAAAAAQASRAGRSVVATSSSTRAGDDDSSAPSATRA